MSLKFSLVSSTGIHFAEMSINGFFNVFFIFPYHFLVFKNGGKGSLRKQPTFCDTPSGFFAK